MRASSLLRIMLVFMMLASISVAGTAVAWRAGETILSIAASDAAPTTVPVQAGELEKQLRSYRVRLNAEGKLPGRINIIDPETGLVSPAREMKIALLKNGQVVTEFQPGIDGVFSVSGVQPGVYSLVGHGDEGYIAYGLEVMPAEFNFGGLDGEEGLQQVAFQEIETELQIDSLAIPPTDGPSVLRLANEHLPEEIVAAASEIAASAETAPKPPEQAPDVSGREDIDPAEIDPAAEAAPAASLRQNEIRLDANGSLTGRVRSLNPQSGQPVRIRRLNVFLVKENEIVAQAPVSPLGVFTFPDLAPGTYSFVAAGTEGFTAFSIRTVANNVAGANITDELTVPVAFQPPGFVELNGTLVSLEDLYYLLYWLRFYYYEDDDDDGGGGLFGGGGPGGPGGFGGGAPPGFGGGAGGGFGGGVGGGFGGGGAGLFGAEGLGALLGLAALGAAAAALADDNDDQPRVVSPANLQ